MVSHFASAAFPTELIAEPAWLNLRTLRQQAQRLPEVPTGLTRDEALQRAIACLDLTSLSPTDTSAHIEALCKSAQAPLLTVPQLHTAAVCVTPRHVQLAVELLAGTDICVASVAGTFPGGNASAVQKAREAEAAVANGAQEIDLIIDHRALRAGRRRLIWQELTQVRVAIGDVRLKVIVESGLLTLRQLEVASRLSLAAGADFLKTSTGTIDPGATAIATLGLAHAAAIWQQRTGKQVGVKPSGGLRSSGRALRLMAAVSEVLGTQALHPGRMRLGASGLLGIIDKELQGESEAVTNSSY